MPDAAFVIEGVVNSVKGDLTFGENSALYASFGYIRKSGLVRTANNVVEARFLV